VSKNHHASHHERRRQQQWKVLRVGGLGDQRTQSYSTYLVTREYHVLRNDTRIPCAAGRGDQSRNEIREYRRYDEQLPATPAGHTINTRRFLEVRRNCHRAGNHVEQRRRRNRCDHLHDRLQPARPLGAHSYRDAERHRPRRRYYQRSESATERRERSDEYRPPCPSSEPGHGVKRGDAAPDHDCHRGEPEKQPAKYAHPSWHYRHRELARLARTVERPLHRCDRMI